MGKALYEISAKVGTFGKDAEALKKIIYNLDLPRYKFIVDASNFNYECNFVKSTEDFIYDNDDFTSICTILIEHIAKTKRLLEEVNNVRRILDKER